MSTRETQHQLRCFCARKPLLACYGVNKKGEVYVHVKIYKQARVFGEIVATGGVVRILCRECLRWHKVKVTQPGTARLEEDYGVIPD